MTDPSEMTPEGSDQQPTAAPESQAPQPDAEAAEPQTTAPAPELAGIATDVAPVEVGGTAVDDPALPPTVDEVGIDGESADDADSATAADSSADDSTADDSTADDSATGEDAVSADAAKAKPAKKAKAQLTPADVVRKVGTTNADAIRFVLDPDPQLARLSRKAKEALIQDLPPLAGGALLGPAALARHFVASAASGRYRDLFSLWDLFRERPEDCKPVLAERQRALEKGREALKTAVRLGIRGSAGRVAEDVHAAQGLIWTWLREALVEHRALVAQRPAIAAAWLAREPDIELPLPEVPDDRWLAEAAIMRGDHALPPSIEQLLAANVERLAPTVDSLAMTHATYPERVEAMLDRVDLDDPSAGPILAWARDHGYAGRLRARISATIRAAGSSDRAGALTMWQSWRDRGIDVPLPDELKQPTLEGLDLQRPETATLLAELLAGGASLQPQAELDRLASQNRQAAEKAYEAFVCAGLDVRLPLALEGNPIVKDGTRCPNCQAWTWVRPGHEKRCPRSPGSNDPFSSQLASAEPTSSPITFGG